MFSSALAWKKRCKWPDSNSALFFERRQAKSKGFGGCTGGFTPIVSSNQMISRRPEALARCARSDESEPTLALIGCRTHLDKPRRKTFFLSSLPQVRRLGPKRESHQKALRARNR